MEVTVYTTPSCGYCKAEISWLEELGIEHTTKDVVKDPSARKELLELVPGATGVPITSVNGTIIRGFDRPKLKEALNVE